MQNTLAFTASDKGYRTEFGAMLQHMRHTQHETARLAEHAIVLRYLADVPSAWRTVPLARRPLS